MDEIPVLTAPSGLPAEPGSYVLLLELARARRLEVGALGPVDFPEGVYLYVGSARGPGGLRARLGRHLEGRGTPRWHVDRLRREAAPVGAWLQVGLGEVECAWAERLRRFPAVETPVPGFGASDCSCSSHLLRCLTLPMPTPPPGGRGITALWRPSSPD